MTDDLVAFLNARLSEDARVAEAAAPGPWSETGRHSVGEGMVHSDTTGWAVVGSVSTGYGPKAPYANVSLNAAHIARFNPARVLADADAKRRIVAECEAAYGQDSRGMASLADGTLALLALPYAGHPDYRKEWRP